MCRGMVNRKKPTMVHAIYRRETSTGLCQSWGEIQLLCVVIALEENLIKAIWRLGRSDSSQMLQKVSEPVFPHLNLTCGIQMV